jgi:23S rRNA (uracil1939-C5)-methyltransferase
LPDFGLQFFFKPQDFTQVNSSLNRKMVSRAVEFLDLKDRDTVLDLFCGLGNFSLPMAMTAGHVIGVEGDEEMVARASRNAERNQRQNVEFHAADLFETMEEESWSQREFNKVLLDPPRSGAEEVSRWLAQKAPETIVYISCNPSTLARDAGILVHSGGYKLEKAGVMDMFPHTSHTEAMAVFRKSS